MATKDEERRQYLTDEAKSATPVSDSKVVGTKDDQEAVAAFMLEHGFEWIEVNKHFFGGGYWNVDLPDGKYMSVSPITAAFFHQALKQREDELYKRISGLYHPSIHDLELNEHQGKERDVVYLDEAVQSI